MATSGTSTITPTSKSKIGLLTCIFLTVAITIGNGIYTNLGFQLVTISNGFTILALWGIAGLCALCGALSYAELASRLPHSGGEYYYLSKIYHPALGTMAGIITLLAGFIAPVALASIAFGHYFQACFSGCPALLSSCLLITVVTVAHLFNIHFSALFQDSITIFKFLLIGIILYFGFRYVSISPTLLLPSSSAIKELLQPNTGVALLFCFYAYSGWNATVYIADDVASSRRTVGVSLVVGTLLVIFIYLLLNTIFLLAAPMNELRGTLDIATIAMKHLIGESGGRIMSGLIAGSLIAGVSGMIWVGPRIIETMGKEIPSLSFFSIVSSKNIPIYSALLQYVAIIVVLLTSSFSALLISTQVAVIFCSLLSVLGLMLLRYRESKARIYNNRQEVPKNIPDQSGFSCPLYPVPPLVFTVVSTVALFYTIKSNPYEATIGVAIILLGLALHFFLTYWSKNK